MKFTELTIHTTSEGSELVADVLWRYTNYGVAISDVKDVIALQRNKAMYWDYIDDSLTKDGGEALVKAFVALNETENVVPLIRSDLEELKVNGGDFVSFGTLECTRRIVEGDDWIEIWKKHFRPLHIGEKIVVCPEWIEYEKQPDEQVVLLDSNMAFGTGEHETTSMCLKLLQEYITPQSVCVDVGCGSGILGISAVKLGAKFAYLTDIDDIAVKSATHNSEINGVSDRIKVVRSDLLGDAEINADLVFANITAEILCRLAPSVTSHLKRGGTLVLSGIIESRLDMVLDAFSAQGLKLEKQLKEGEWFALSFKL
ncbi:MAG: 50S ribosomal protein L11 methyltransferase [Clostridia bacterium]|jgi:ribosomal protein L11 methyltransferase|nr:50S ribosomal protein L11 methyltransferase [Clostridia bacterium]